MRRALLVLVPLAVLVAGCGGGTTVSPTPQTVVGTVNVTTTPAPKLPPGNAAGGAKVFASAGCGGCHTLKAAGSTGAVGPNLDQLTPKPTLARIQIQVIKGGGPMPPYKGQLSDQQIADVAQYVYTSIGGH